MDFTSETMQARKEWCEIFKVSKKKKIHAEEFQIIYMDILKEERHNFLTPRVLAFHGNYFKKAHMKRERNDLIVEKPDQNYLS